MSIIPVTTLRSADLTLLLARCDKDNEKFLEEYPEAAKSVKSLLRAINNAREE